MDAGKASAINAYRNQLRMMQQAADQGAGSDEAAKPSFSQMVGDAMKDAASNVYESDKVQMEALTGKVDLTDLVTAVSNAELTLNTVVAVRDRVISAYQDIIRMSI